MNRRETVIALLAFGAAPHATFAQEQGRVWSIGYLASSSPKANARALETFRAGLRDQGYVEGRNLRIESRWTDDSVADLPKAAAELVALKVDLILAWTTPAALAAKKASATTPIVMTGVADPVGVGLVSGLAHPGGNVTGVSNISADLSGKLVELLQQIVPGISRFAGVRNVLNPSSAQQLKETEAAVRALGLQFQLVEIRGANDIEPAFASMAKARAGGAVFFADPLWVSRREQIAALAMKHRLPCVFARNENVDAGGLVSYGANLAQQFKTAAYMVGKILKGAKPADLPVEQPTTLELVINLKTARAMGVNVPKSLILRADRVIE